MIRNAEVLNDLRESWRTVVDLRDTIKVNIIWSFSGGGYQSPRFRSISYNLVLLFAFSVLERGLVQLRDEGLFKCGSSRAGHLMESSRDSLNWTNYNAVDKVREDRNDMAHHRKIIDQEVVLAHIEAIQTELLAWGILDKE